MSRFRVRCLTTIALITFSLVGLPHASAQLSGLEQFAPAQYNLKFGTQGAGSNSLSGFGLERHGAFGSQNWALRFFDGQPGGTQATGVYDIAYKNGPPVNEVITHHVPNRVPLTTTTLPGGGTFDGTALWIVHSQFQDGLAPSIGTSGATGTRYDGVSGTADTGVDIRPASGSFVNIAAITGQTTTTSYVLSADVFMPNHSTDISPNRTLLRVQPYVDRDGFGLTTPGGHGGFQLNFASFADQWVNLDIRADFTLNGGATAADSDDTGTVTYTYFLNGSQVGGPQMFTLDPTQMSLRNGPVRFGSGFGISRGSQGDAPEFFLDNITASRITTPTLSSNPASGSIFDFGTVEAGQTVTLTDAISIANAGQPDSTIDILSFSFSGPDGDLFDIPDFAAQTLTAGGPAALFDLLIDVPLNEPNGPKSSTLTIVTSAGDLTFTVMAWTLQVPETATWAMWLIGAAAIFGLCLSGTRRVRIRR